MDLLRRELAPIVPEAWSLIDAEAARVLKLNLAGRKLVDVSDPHGWGFAAINTGRLRPLEPESTADLSIGIRTVQALVELRSSFSLAVVELESVGRGGTDPALTALVQACERISHAEDRAIFDGLEGAGISGILGASPHDPITVANVEGYPRAVLAGLEVLRNAGVNEPYALALGATAYDELLAALEDGYPIAQQLEHLLDDKLIFAPSLGQAALVSVRGSDYDLTIGQDFSVGYAGHDPEKVELYLVESFAFRVLEPRAAIRLVPP